MFSMNTSSVDKYVHVCMVIYTSFISKRRKSFAAHFFFTCSPTVHKTFISDCCIFYETMCIELTGECSLKDKWLELE